MQRLSKAEAMIQSHEHKLAVECPTSAVISKKRVVPQVAKAETKKVYKTLLDGETFAGFDLSPRARWKDDANQRAVEVLVKEVKGNNKSFSRSHMMLLKHTLKFYLKKRP
ncbi:uncharacterized protein [Dysidea avara]|uniref:uncharacterized protein n=1 Tax=Dysidea avara TaxID=196820 RepID=UPI0033329D0E